MFLDEMKTHFVVMVKIAMITIKAIYMPQSRIFCRSVLLTSLMNDVLTLFVLIVAYPLPRQNHHVRQRYRPPPARGNRQCHRRRECRRPCVRVATPSFGR